jgi:predicted dehydrogenase
MSDSPDNLDRQQRNRQLADGCLRLAVVGTGFGEQHLAWIAATPGVKVAALGFHAGADRAAALASSYDIDLISDDAVGLVQTADLDGVVIVSPPATHEAIAQAALERGLLVISDKPLATTVAAATRMAELAAASSSPAYVLFQWRLHPLVVALEKYLRDGALGQPVHAVMHFFHDFLAGEKTNWPWRHDWATCGGGALGDVGVHMFDLLAFLLPGTWSVEAARSAIAWRTRDFQGRTVEGQTDDASDVLLSEEGTGTSAAISVSRIAVGIRRISVIVTGTTGSAELQINPEDGSGSLQMRSIGEDTSRVERAEAGCVNPYPALQAALRDGNTANFATFADALRAQEILADAVNKLRQSSANRSGEATSDVQ